MTTRDRSTRPPSRSPDPPKHGISEVRAFRLRVVEGELARLRDRKAEAFDLLDEHDRESIEVGIGAELSKPLRLLERYESACWRRNRAERARTALTISDPR